MMQHRSCHVQLSLLPLFCLTGIPPPCLRSLNASIIWHAINLLSVRPPLRACRLRQPSWLGRDTRTYPSRRPGGPLKLRQPALGLQCAALHVGAPALQASDHLIASRSFVEVEKHPAAAPMPAVFKVAAAPTGSVAGDAFQQIADALVSPHSATQLLPQLELAETFRLQGGRLVEAAALQQSALPADMFAAMLPSTMRDAQLNTVNLWNFGAQPGALVPHGAAFHLDRSKRPTEATFDGTVLVAVHGARRVFLYEPEAFERATRVCASREAAVRHVSCARQTDGQ